MLSAPSTPHASQGSRVHHVTLSIETRERVEIVDLTSIASATVQAFGLLEGVAIVQTRHTTTGILVNEHEPLLLLDLKAMFERLVPADLEYAHDQFARRSAVAPDERRNGDAHCRAALLHASETIPVCDGALALGRWQRVLLVELDGGQRRQISLTLMGHARSLGGDWPDLDSVR